MKSFLAAFAIIFIAACKHPETNIQRKQLIANTKKIDTSTVKEDVEQDKPINKYDSTIVTIFAEGHDSTTYTNFELKMVLKDYPELNQDINLPPDETYWGRSSWKTIPEKDKSLISSFSSEVGRDTYYLLYAYFLKYKIHQAQEKNKRQTLVNIFRKINEIHARLNNGGTYFGHQYTRIIGYAEYALSNYDDYNSLTDKEVIQKKLFISLLQNYLSNVVQEDNNNGLTPSDKKKKIKELVTIVSELNGLVTDAYLLRQAQQFEYSYY